MQPVDSYTQVSSSSVKKEKRHPKMETVKKVVFAAATIFTECVILNSINYVYPNLLKPSGIIAGETIVIGLSSLFLLGQIIGQQNL